MSLTLSAQDSTYIIVSPLHTIRGIALRFRYLLSPRSSNPSAYEAGLLPSYLREWKPSHYPQRWRLVKIPHTVWCTRRIVEAWRQYPTTSVRKWVLVILGGDFHYYWTFYSGNVPSEFCSHDTRMEALLTLVVHMFHSTCVLTTLRIPSFPDFANSAARNTSPGFDTM